MFHRQLILNNEMGVNSTLDPLIIKIIKGSSFQNIQITEKPAPYILSEHTHVYRKCKEALHF